MSDTPLTVLEKLTHQFALRLFRLPHAVQVRLSGAAPIERDGLTLHPEMQLFLALRRALRMPGLTTHPVTHTRRLVRREALVHAGEPVAVRAVRDFSIPGPGGPLKLRHYAPADVRARPLLVFLHGGGFALGDLETHDAACRILCREADLHVLALDYRLAPEHPFPAAVDDALAGFRWAVAHAAELGADPARVGIGGDSAGGNLSAVVAQLAKEGGEPAPALQLLIYPAVDRAVERPSLTHFAEGFYLTRRDIEAFAKHYVGEHLVGPDPRVEPLAAPSLAGLAPAIVVTAGFDPLRDEGEAYAEALRAAGTPVALRRFDRLIHAFVNFTSVSPACRSAVEEIARLVRDAFERPRP